MRGWLFTGAAMLVAATTAASAAQFAGPRASSEHGWLGMSSPAVASQAAPATAPHYVWQEGYDRGGKWHGRWVLVQ